LFPAPSTIDGDPSPDISGMIGQFAHGNEPSHHILNLYTMIGEPQKTAKWVREIMLFSKKLQILRFICKLFAKIQGKLFKYSYFCTL
jgi:hypothetical protein